MGFATGKDDELDAARSTGRSGDHILSVQPAFTRTPVSLVTNDPRIREVLGLVEQVADTDATVLITGESGTGKELIARALHQKSSRRNAAFVAVNCGAIPEALEESELFGHLKGAFTGASERKLGRFEAADGGTILLDEISEMGRAFQVKLLRVLQSGEYAPVGVAENRYCDVRVVAATNQELQPLIDTGQFRQDLYYRLNIICLELSPLRERRPDIPLLMDHFLGLFRAAYCKPKIQIGTEATEALLRYDYPGNVRELENTIRRAVILCRDEWISTAHLQLPRRAERSAPSGECPARFREAKGQVVEEFERTFLISALNLSGGIVSRAARLSGLSERNFHEKLRKYGIKGHSFRA